jgi:hypothetical protein
MVLGLVVHHDHRARFEQATTTLSGVTFAWATYGHDDEIRDTVGALLAGRALDGLLLGRLPWARAHDLLPAGLPVAVTRSAALDLALAWARARGEGRPATPVSIDTFDRETVDEVATALGLDHSAIAVLPFDPAQEIAEVVAFHRAHGAPFVISVRTAVAAALGDSVPVLNALATPGTIRADLHELALRVQSRRADRQRFAAAVFRRFSGADDQTGLLNLLRTTPELADAWIDDRGRRGIVVFAPAALFETITQHWVTLPLLATADETLGVRVAAGFGVGGSARTCVALAERAAARAAEREEPSAYLISEDGVVIGPMGASGTPLAYTYRGHGGLETLAGRVGLSAATLSRLAAIERRIGDQPVSPSELARSLGITDPSGRRLIRKLSESRLAVDDGSSQLHPKGRPTRLYRLAITAALEVMTDCTEVRPARAGDGRDSEGQKGMTKEDRS